MKMKRIFILIAVAATIGTSDSQNETTAEQTTFSGDGDVSTPGVVTNPCLSDPCNNGGLCISDGTSDMYSCQCVSGFTGNNCDTEIQCTEKTIAGSNEEIQPDSGCNQVITYTDENNTVPIMLSNTNAGMVASANQTCMACATGTMLPLATVECKDDGEFGDPRYIDCSAGPDELSDGDRISLSVGVTAEPTDITADSTEFAITSTSQVVQTESTITQTDATSILLVYNNLLDETISEDGANTVNDQSETMISTIDELANKVVLDNTGSQAVVGNVTNYYVSIQENLALVVTEDPVSDVFVFSNGQLANGANIKTAGLWLIKDPTAFGEGATYIQATRDTSSTRAIVDRISFSIYSSPSTLFANLPNVISTVLSAQGKAQFTFNFNAPSTQRTEIRRWNNVSKKWDGQESSSCQRVTENTGENDARFLCQDAGKYVLVTVDTTGDPGLSTGAIVGIVIGSIAGAAIICGGVYYFAFYAKKKKRKNKISSSQDEMKMTDVEDD